MEVPTSQPIIKYFTHSAFCIFFYCCAKTLIAEKMCENWQVNITWQRSNVISLYHMARLYCITWQLYLMSILYLFTKLYSISWLHTAQYAVTNLPNYLCTVCRCAVHVLCPGPGVWPLLCAQPGCDHRQADRQLIHMHVSFRAVLIEPL